MSNYNQTLQTNNSSLEDIIIKINELPDAGSDSMSVETCTVTISSNKSIYGYAYTTFENNEINFHCNGDFAANDMADLGKEIVLNNIICGSILIINVYIAPAELFSTFVTETVSGDVQIIYKNGNSRSDFFSNYAFRVPLTMGESASVYIEHTVSEQ